MSFNKVGSSANGDVRLEYLNGRFIGDYNRESKTYHELESMIGAQGVMFQCPKCAQGKPITESDEGYLCVPGAHYVICWFRNPKNARPVPDDIDPGPGRWTAWGDNIANLTLTPSINLPGKGCGWHAYVRDGIATLV